MKKNLLLLFIFYFTLIISSHGAGDGGGSDSDKYKSPNLKKGVSLIKKGKKLEKKGKIEKAKKRFDKALEYLIIGIGINLVSNPLIKTFAPITCPNTKKLIATL